MKVLYDISILGLGYAHPNLRTGLHRVVKNVAEQLLNHPECEMTFSSSVDSIMQSNCLAYLASNSKLSCIPFSLPPYYYQRLWANQKKSHLTKKRLKLIDSVIENKAENIIKKLPRKVQIRSMWLQEKIYGLYNVYNNVELIHPKDLQRADIYHSPYYAIPEQVKKAQKKTVFITSYDLIPVLGTQYVTPGHTVFFKNLLASITPETWILCISRDCRNDLLNYMGNRVNPDRVGVTELAASDTFYPSSNKENNREIRKKYSIPDGPYMLSLCSLEPRKNIDSVIKAFAKIVQQENLPDLNLVLVGPKAWGLDKMFQELEASRAVKNRIIIPGFVVNEDLAAIYSDALVFVYPSFYEGFGLPPLEAMQCGTPAITSNTTSLPEVVGDAGIMINPTDLDALCDAMLSIYKSPFLREDLSRRSLERANKFSWEKCAQATVDAYKLSLS